ncbi:unnamed protein product [Discula destructiva]
MFLPDPLRRQGAIPGLARLISLVLECISIAILALHKDPHEVYTTDYVILGYLISVDILEIAFLCGQAREWFLPALPVILAEDIIGMLILMCSRDWYGYWHWHGPYYSLSHKIGMGIFITLPSLRLLLIALESLEYWYDNREDRVLAAERQFLLPH